ncbi:MAG: hypothetical protein JW971_01730 [Synergistales bacterium]|nr:hypothetical protein [Synergistales bacterium]
MSKITRSLGISLIALVATYGVSEARSFEDLYNSYFGEEVVPYRVEHSQQSDIEDMWFDVRNEADPRKRADIGLHILEKAVGGDPSQWNIAEGFVEREGYPLPVVLFQTTLITISSLYEVGDPGSMAKARDLAESLISNPETLTVLRRSSGSDVLEVRRALRARDHHAGAEYLQVGGNGILQFNIAPLEKVRGNIREYNAWSSQMIFLNNSGQITSGIGRYAWDWRSGKVYRIIDREDTSLGTFASDGQGPAPGGGDDGNAGNTDDDDDDDDNSGPVGDDDDDDDNGGPGNGNGNSGNPGNGGGNNNGSGPGSGNNGNNNGQGNGSDNGGGGSDNEGSNGNGNTGSGPGNGNGNAGNPGNGGGNNNGSGPGSGNNGTNNGQDGSSESSENDNGGSRSGLGDGTNPGGGSGNNNAGGSAGGSGSENPGGS